ncbi:hypothetical protein [Photobacterium kasasachensis]|uniref:hypothetical protein n=1 Tax=Photobacterium kasasachensis TaxID=2910240 RepID=UPI003D119273
MKSSLIPEVNGIKSILYGTYEKSERVYVYLHGAGEFGQGIEGQYKYPGFATLLRDGEISLGEPFIIACCMDGSHWLPDSLTLYLNAVSTFFSGAQIDLIGYSRGGEGVYEYLQRHVNVRTATVINSEVPQLLPTNLEVPLHVIHASHDQFTSFDKVQKFVELHLGDTVKLTKWEGNHFSIEAIALSKEWQKWIEQPDQRLTETAT